MKSVPALALALALAWSLTGVRAAAEDPWIVRHAELNTLFRKELRTNEQIFLQGSNGKSRHGFGETRSANDLFTFTTDDPASLAERLRTALVAFMKGRNLSNVRSETGDLQMPHSTVSWSYEDPRQRVAGSLVVWFLDASSPKFKLIVVTTETHSPAAP